jgi:hypothetical protein
MSSAALIRKSILPCTRSAATKGSSPRRSRQVRATGPG